ncbi:MAG: hypothetical protein H0Z34_01465 [Brevibacillus sp.]|nr:hypothetical protein [Brevibacillus sp.]
MNFPHPIYPHPYLPHPFHPANQVLHGCRPPFSGRSPAAWAAPCRDSTPDTAEAAVCGEQAESGRSLETQIEELRTSINHLSKQVDMLEDQMDTLEEKLRQLKTVDFLSRSK